MSIPLKIYHSMKLFFDQIFGERMLAVFFCPLLTASNRVSGGNASISSTLQNQVRYKDLQVNLQRDLDGLFF
jgi:hypothetical protein